MSEKYDQALHEAQAELQKIDERRAALMRLIECLKVLSGDDAYELTPPPGYAPMGLTGEIRKILEITTVPLEPVQIRDSLIQRGVQHSSSKNLLINVHTVLDRIEKELDKVEKDGKTAYRMKDVYRSGMRGMESIVAPIDTPKPPKHSELLTEPPEPLSTVPSPPRPSYSPPPKTKKND